VQVRGTATPADAGGLAVQFLLRDFDEDKGIAEGISPGSTQGHIVLHSPQNVNNGHRSVAVAAGRASGAEPPGQSHSHASTSAGVDGTASAFRNRVSELEQVTDGLMSPDGEHFWFVIAPPQLGKTWFLNQVDKILTTQVPGTWKVRRVDLRTQPDKVVRDAWALIQVMFAGPSSASAGELPEITARVLASGTRQLYLLDSAELLDDVTVRGLRTFLAQINQQVEAVRYSNVRLALIVASRRDPEWLGITPKPRLRRLPLSEFRIDVVAEALEQLANRLDYRLTSAQFHEHANLVHRLSEGLPALLVKYLDWIEAQRWVDLHRLEDQQRFDQLSRPYVEDVLLSPSSLLGPGADPADERLPAIKQALKALVRYRLFTQSHLSHHAPEVAALVPLGWSIEQIWAAVSSTALLHRPQGEPWHQIHAPIRRLLSRYWYPTPDLRVRAHVTALEFVRSLATERLGRDEAAILAECLWHAAQALSDNTPAELSRRLIELARTLSVGLLPSSAFTQDDLRVCAKELMEGDEELADMLGGIDGLFEKLIDVIVRP
jgi:hypothetical protein